MFINLPCIQMHDNACACVHRNLPANAPQSDRQRLPKLVRKWQGVSRLLHYQHSSKQIRLSISVLKLLGLFVALASSLHFQQTCGGWCKHKNLQSEALLIPGDLRHGASSTRGAGTACLLANAKRVDIVLVSFSCLSNLLIK